MMSPQISCLYVFQFLSELYIGFAMENIHNTFSHLKCLRRHIVARERWVEQAWSKALTAL